MTTVVAISDTHRSHARLTIPPGDVLVHTGDLDAHRLEDLREFDRWLAGLPHPHKLVIAGNHDAIFVREPEAARAALTHATYLQDEACEVAGLRVYGSPWQPVFCNMAFNLPRGPSLQAVWARIPADTDVLLTHGPPAGILDRTFIGQRVGCADLLARIEQVAPALHVFGHIHEAAGHLRQGPTTFVNAATGFRCRRGPTVIELERGVATVRGVGDPPG